MSLQLQTPHPQPKQSHVIGSKSFDQPLAFVPSVIPITLDLFDTKQSPPRLEFLDSKIKQKRSWEDQNITIETMSRRNTPKLDLKLNLSPPQRAVRRVVESPSRSASVSPPSSCLSSEMNGQDGLVGYSNSPEATSMVLVGCPRCLMYVMLSEDDPKCPKCKSTVLLDFVHHNNNNNNNNNNNSSSNNNDDENNNNNNIGSSKKTRRN